MIYILENIFPDNVRKELIKESIPLLLSRKEMAKKGSIYESNKRKNFPGSQTLSNLHTLPQFKEVIDSLTYLIIGEYYYEIFKVFSFIIFNK